MTVKGVNQIISEKKLKTNIDLKNNRTRRKVAVDANLILYRCKATVIVELRKKLALNARIPDEKTIQPILNERLTKFVTKLLYCNLEPIFVFDGRSKGGKIVATKRTEKRKKNEREYALILGKVNKTLPISPFHAGNRALFQTAAKLEKQVRTPIVKYNIQGAKMHLEALGIPVLTAEGEGEKLCSFLVREGYAYAVYSNDGDCHAYAAPIVIKPMNGGRHTIVHHKDILSSLGVTQSQFVDCCILAGCDYNYCPPSWSFKSALKTIKMYGSLAKYLDCKKDTKLEEALCIASCMDEFCTSPNYMFSISDLELKNTKRLPNVDDTFYTLRNKVTGH